MIIDGGQLMATALAVYLVGAPFAAAYPTDSSAKAVHDGELVLTAFTTLAYIPAAADKAGVPLLKRLANNSENSFHEPTFKPVDTLSDRTSIPNPLKRRGTRINLRDFIHLFEPLFPVYDQFFANLFMYDSDQGPIDVCSRRNIDGTEPLCSGSATPDSTIPIRANDGEKLQADQKAVIDFTQKLFEGGFLTSPSS